MKLDAQQLYSDAQALTATAVSTNLIDHGADGNLGIGEPMVVMLVVDVVLDDTTGDETYVATLQADDNAAFSSAATVGTFTMTRGDAAGTKYFIPVPPTTTMEQFSRISYTLGGTTPTCTLTAFLIPQSMVQNDFNYPNGYTIS